MFGFQAVFASASRIPEGQKVEQSLRYNQIPIRLAYSSLVCSNTVKLNRITTLPAMPQFAFAPSWTNLQQSIIW
jgi:hypothetical protein